MCIARCRKYCQVSTTNIATPNWIAGVMKWYKVVAVISSQVANLGTCPWLPVPTLTRSVKDGYRPPEMAPASIEYEPAMLLASPPASTPTKDSSHGSARCARRTLLAHTETSYSCFPVKSSGSVIPSSVAIIVCSTC